MFIDIDFKIAYLHYYCHGFRSIYIHAASAQGCGDWHFAGAGCKGGRYLGFTDRHVMAKENKQNHLGNYEMEPS